MSSKQPDLQTMVARNETIAAKHGVPEVRGRLAALVRRTGEDRRKLEQAREAPAGADLEFYTKRALGLPASPNGHLQDVGELQRQVRGDERAQATIEAELSVVIDRASAEAQSELAPIQTKHVVRTCELIEALSRELMFEENVRDSLTAAGLASAGLRPMGIPLIGRLDDGQSLVRRYLAEAEEFGYLPRGYVAALPEVKLERSRREARAAQDQRARDEAARRERLSRRERKVTAAGSRKGAE